MRTTLRSLLAIMAMAIAACGETPVEPAFPDSPSLTVAGATEIAVLNWNVFVGADVDAVIEALATPDPTDDVPTLLAAVQTFEETDVVARLQAVARAIAVAQPHVVGLQEISQIDVDLTGLGIPVDIEVDFLPILLAALAAEGASEYVVAGIVQNVEAAPLPGVRVVDHDAMLVDATRVTVSTTTAENYQANIGELAPGVNVVRGWVSVDATIDGRSYTFATTHLESGQGADLSLLRAAQATELVAALNVASPVILMGDLNDGPESLMAQVVTGAGFTDLWRALRPGAAGLTCCHLPNLADPRADFHQRIDYVLARGFGHPVDGVQGRIDRLGEVPADRLSGPVHPIWPSDHTGLVARLLMVPALVLPVAAGQ